jgi:DNA repair protein RadC
MNEYTEHSTIRCWAEDDRPREKMLLKGRHNLSDAEILALLLGSGTREDTAVDLGRKLLGKAGGNLISLSKLTITEMIAVKGIGQARAVTIQAALELGRRINATEAIVRQKVRNSTEAYAIFKSHLSDLLYEEFWIIMLSRANRIVKSCVVSQGGVSGTVVDPKKIFRMALDHHASSLILGHNHPSGSFEPSLADDHITWKMREAGKLMEIDVIDHIIVGDNGFYSYSDQSRMDRPPAKENTTRP